MTAFFEEARGDGEVPVSAYEIDTKSLRLVEDRQGIVRAMNRILNFELYVDDDRYSVPTLHLITAADDRVALDVAMARLAESDHHSGVELWRDGERLAALGAPRRLRGAG